MESISLEPRTEVQEQRARGPSHTSAVQDPLVNPDQGGGPG